MATPTSELIQRVPPKEKVSFEEFIGRLDEDTWVEWVDGAIVPMALPVSIQHQEACGFLGAILGIYVEEQKLGKIIIPPFVMRLSTISRGRVPDLLFIKRDRPHLLTRNYLDGPADLAVEVLLPESEERDSEIKFAEYEAAGVREYWLLDPDHQTAEFYELGEDGRYTQAPLDEAGIYRSKVVAGFWLRADWLWQTPLPATLDVLRELKVL